MGGPAVHTAETLALPELYSIVRDPLLRLLAVRYGPRADKVRCIEHGPADAAALGRYPQVAGLRWARVVTAMHPNGVPAQVMRFPIHADLGLETEFGPPTVYARRNDTQ